MQQCTGIGATGLFTGSAGMAALVGALMIAYTPVGAEETPASKIVDAQG